MFSTEDLARYKQPQWEDRIDTYGNTLRIRKLPVRLLRHHFIGAGKIKDQNKQAERQDELLACCIVQDDGLTPVGTADDYRDIPTGVAIEWATLVLEVNKLGDVAPKEDGSNP